MHLALVYKDFKSGTFQFDYFESLFLTWYVKNGYSAKYKQMLMLMLAPVTAAVFAQLITLANTMVTVQIIHMAK